MNCPGEAARRISIARGPAGWVCSTMTIASAPRGTGPPVAIEVAVPDSTGRIGAVPQAMTSSLSMTRTGGPVPRGGKIGGAHRKAVDIGAVERRHVDRRHDILRQRAAERIGKRPLLGWDRARKQRSFETPKRILARQNGQELVLIQAVTAFRRGRIAHVGTHISRAAYKHLPVCPQQNLRWLRAPRASHRRGRWSRAACRRQKAASRYLQFVRAGRFR